MLTVFVRLKLIAWPRGERVLLKIWSIALLSIVLPLGSIINADSSQTRPLNQTEVNVQGNLQNDPEAAYSRLKNAQTLESAYIGFAGILSENLRALREILQSEKAESQLHELYQSGTWTAKLYAIIGLQLLAKPGLAQSLIEDASQYQSEVIEAMEGCVIYQTTVGEALKMIQDGYYVEQFQTVD